MVATEVSHKSVVLFGAVLLCHIWISFTTVWYNMSEEVLASVAQLDARQTGDQEVRGSTQPGRQQSFIEI